MKRIIIGIHGLGNKPPVKLLEQWWHKSLLDGLARIKSPCQSLPFQMIYWADILHPLPLDPNLTDQDNPLFIDEPYREMPAVTPIIEDNIKRKLFDYIEKQLDNIFLNQDMTLNFKSVTDRIIHHYFADLETYYSQEEATSPPGQKMTREIIQERLIRVLDENRNKEILLIAHSMGSIIAYEVLKNNENRFNVHTLITIGSPLGTPPVISKILSLQKKTKIEINKVTTPENIKEKWYNFSDPEDKVALDHTLADDYGKNSRNIEAIDEFVVNDYINNDERNPHKAYGYLRTPQLAKILHTFLAEEQYSWPRRYLDKLLNFARLFRNKYI